MMMATLLPHTHRPDSLFLKAQGSFSLIKATSMWEHLKVLRTMTWGTKALGHVASAKPQSNRTRQSYWQQSMMKMKEHFKINHSNLIKNIQKIILVEIDIKV